MILPTRKDAEILRGNVGKVNQSRGAGVHNSPGGIVTAGSFKRERRNDPLPIRVILLGTPTTATTTSPMTLQPCDSAGVSTGAPTVSVKAVLTALPSGTNIPVTAIIPYQAAAPVGSAAPLLYALGQPKLVVSDTRLSDDGTTFKMQKKTILDFGWFASTSSDWTDCDTSGGGAEATGPFACP
jgi:hypothetical protein